MTDISSNENPITLFKSWFAEAHSCGLKEPDSMVVATATKEGLPSARVALLRKVDEKGFVFFTNLTSRKGKELHSNPHAALCFYWMPLMRQVRVEGTVERCSEKEADEYFLSRPRGSQIGAWASKQSSIMEEEGELPKRIQEIADKFAGEPIPRPFFWSGFRVIPTRIEFWQEGKYRLHTRIVYSKTAQGWNVERLYP